MTTEEQREHVSSPDESELRLISRGEQVLAELTGRIGAYFRRAEVRKRARRYLQGLLAAVERKNGWRMAEELAKPTRMGCSGCWKKPTGMSKPSATNCARM
jgi:hypothetical protein